MSETDRPALPVVDRRQGDRRAPGDRRHSGRPGRRFTEAVVGGVLLSTLAMANPAAAQEAMAKGVVVRTGRRATDVAVMERRPELPAAPLRFGTEVKSLGRAEKAGLDFGYGVIWTGAWNEKYGWTTPREELREAKKRGVTPVIHWWYWGDEISPAAVQDGVKDMRHGVRKDRASWTRMANELSVLIAREMGDREAIVVLETEFNKQGIENYEPFDALLVEQAKIFKSRGNVRTMVGFGNWGSAQWGRFDAAVAASDMVGTQLLRSSVREPGSRYLGAVETLVSGARSLGAKFGKPVMIMDLALSSYPSAEYEGHQAKVLGELFGRTADLKRAGVVGVIWRQIVDDPKFDTSNYHGQAERHWGVLRADGSEKPAFKVLREGIQQESGAGTGD